MYASCSLRLVGGNIPASIVADQQYDIVDMFTPEDNSNIKYFVTDPAGNFFPNPVTNPRSHVFDPNIYQPSTPVLIQARDITIENYTGQSSCRQTIPTAINSGCPITLPRDGIEYFFNNTSYFEVNTGVTPKEYKVCRRTDDPIEGNTTPSIKSLLATGAGNVGTKYYVQLIDRSNGTVYAYITPGIELYTEQPLGSIPPELQWDGNEVLTLKYYPGQSVNTSWWGWTITGGRFDDFINQGGLYNRWALSTTKFLDFDPQSQYFLGVPSGKRLADCSILITAYNDDIVYNNLCSNSINIVPPIIPGNNTQPCVLGQNVECISDGRGGFIIQGIGTPGRQVLCIGQVQCPGGGSFGGGL